MYNSISPFLLSACACSLVSPHPFPFLFVCALLLLSADAWSYSFRLSAGCSLAQEAKAAFKELLESVHATSDWTWDQVRGGGGRRGGGGESIGYSCHMCSQAFCNLD